MALKVTKDTVAAALGQVRTLTTSKVMIGVPASTAGRDDGSPINNAAIGYIQENGSPAQNIPARPFLVPGVASIRDRAAERLKTGAVQAMNGSADAGDRALKAVGLLGQNAARLKITEGPFAPLSERTLEERANRRGRSKGRKGAIQELANRAAGMDASTEFAPPLIDTGQLRAAITHVVRKK